jgi:sugar/nucleoside kinase (ribokinase family)
MSEAKYGVISVGNALVDVLSEVPEDFIPQMNDKLGDAHQMEKNTMALVFDQAVTETLYNAMPADRVQTSGGSAANTMAGFASFGGQGAFIGKVASDDLGKAFAAEIQSQGIHYDTEPLAFGASTGRCMIFVTPDGHRTMNTFLGASSEIQATDVEEEQIAQAQVTYLEGYLFDRDQAKHAFIAAAEYAHKNGHRVALTLSDPFCVDRHRSDFLRLVENHVDILFANEEEIKSLFLQDSFDNAKSAIDKHVEIAVLTRGEKGATIISRASEFEIAPVPVEKVVDTTGAGDQFAAGFLYGFTSGKSLEISGKLGALAAAEVISHIGPRPKVSLAELAKEHDLL